MSFIKNIIRLFGGNKKQKEAPLTAKPAVNTIGFTLNELTEAEKNYAQDAGLKNEDARFLKSLTRRPVESLKFENERTVNAYTDGICSLTTEENARKIVQDHLERLKAEGKYIFISGVAYNGYKIALTAATSDQYRLMELAGVNGFNHDIDTTAIIDKYKKWDREFGVTLISIGNDFCECQVNNKNIDYPKLAGEVYEFCPDVVDQGTGTIEALEDEIKQTGTIYLWWD